MDDGLKPEKSTGYTPPIKTGKGKGLAPVKSTATKKVSPVYPPALTKEESLISTPEASASEVLAIQVVMGDFQEIKETMPKSWQASSNGKIYWCVEYTGHKLQIVEGKLLVDGVPAKLIVEKALAEEPK